MRDVQPKGEIKPAIDALVGLEQQFARNVKSRLNRSIEIHRWRPVPKPSSPSLWNLIDDGEPATLDMARVQDTLLVAVTIAVDPADISEASDKLVDLMDVFRATIDPDFDTSTRTGPGPLEGKVVEAHRATTRMVYPKFANVPMVGLTTLVRLRLEAAVR